MGSGAQGEAVELSDEELRKLLKPNPTPAQVIDVLTKSYVETTSTSTEVKILKELESYDDRNYWVDIDGTSYLVKVHNGVESKDYIDCLTNNEYEKSVIHLQNAMMLHLASNGVSTSEPQMPISKTGEGVTNIPPTPASVHDLPVHSVEHSPCPLVVRLLRWVPGQTMSSLKMLPLEALADTGRFLGRLANQLGTLPNEENLTAAKRYHQWDGKNLIDLRNFVQYIINDEKRSMVISIIDTFEKDIIQSGVAQQLPTGLIHGDFNDANIIVDNQCFTKGVIDFGDSVESWRVLEVSVAMAYACLSSYGKNAKSSIAAAAALLRGYNAVNPLENIEREHLHLLIVCRLACSVTLGAFSYYKNPGNEYLLLHAQPAWNAIELLWGSKPEQRQQIVTHVNRVLDLACTNQNKDFDISTVEVIDCSDLAFPDPTVVDPMASVRVSSTNL